MILASKSPRRREILENFGFNLDIITIDIEEVSLKESIHDQIMDISYKKSYEVAKNHPSEYVVGADTVVVIDNTILGKPKDEEEIYSMLKSLSGKTHKVITAYTMLNLSKEFLINDFDETLVTFKEISDDEIKWYISTKEPFDKAGAYGIQGFGNYFVKEIKGDYFSVMGFPVGKLLRNLTSLGFSLDKIKDI